MRRLVLLILLPAAAWAHVGNPDVYFDGKAGPYDLFVTVRPPMVIPGVAAVEVRAASAAVKEIRAVPLALSGVGSQYAPIADKLTVSPQDPQFFTGSVWMMAHGSWQIRISVNGDAGSGSLAVPLPSVARTVKRMQVGLGALLGVLGLFLAGGLVAMTGSGVREARLEPGLAASAPDRRRGRVGTVLAIFAVAGVVWGGAAWWASEAHTYGSQIYQPLQMRAALESGSVMTLKLVEPGWMQAPRPGTLTRILFVRKMDDLVPDHGHLMHLYAIRQPDLDQVFHLHPALAGTGLFRLALPDMPAGNYKLYADIVHEDGFAETMVTSIRLPGISGKPLSGDDAEAKSVSWKNATGNTSFSLPDGYRMEWLRGTPNPRAREATLFHFRLLAADGSAPGDMALYMGMLGHAAFVKTDGTAFAHIHPNGSPAMAAVMLCNGIPNSGMQSDGMPGMDMKSTTTPHGKSPSSLPNDVTFPYGFPEAGSYRIIVQMKHGNTIETGIFDATAN